MNTKIVSMMAVALTLCSCGGKKAQKGAAAVKEGFFFALI